eukprot:TRINITY_DN3631_c0_g1_i2.p1 TRINITY_DN3631_c0_g1~~TRINITY_DN3631_c0_g1_i2.p1  ORF type:complete len:387 (+),score=82.45 TRINITY_DN3631_c0_g1_i2:82-1242(+)
MGLMDMINSALYYDSTKYITVQSKKLGIFYYLVILGIMGYIIGYVLIYNKGYQVQDPLQGIVVVKLKGASFPVGNGPQPLWDSVDVVHPSKEPNAMFVTSNYLFSPNQYRGICVGNTPDEMCNATTTGCVEGRMMQRGIDTGICDTDSGFCKINAWCPLPEDTVVPDNVLPTVGNMTVFVRVNVRFPQTGIMRDNANGTGPTLGWNMFTIQDMAMRAGAGWHDKMLSNGAVIAVKSVWECNLDQDASLCMPQPFSFMRVDDKGGQAFSSGYNYRYARYYYNNTAAVPSNPTEALLQQRRDLTKVFGFRLLFLVTGYGAKFSVVPVVLNIGSGLGLLTLATVITDKLMIWFWPGKQHYRKAKYDAVEEARLAKQDASDDEHYQEINA